MNRARPLAATFHVVEVLDLDDLAMVGESEVTHQYCVCLVRDVATQVHVEVAVRNRFWVGARERVGVSGWGGLEANVPPLW